MGAVGGAVDDGCGEAFVVEGLAPFAERGVGRDGDRGAFFSLGEDLGEQLGGVLVEVDAAEFVYGEQVVAVEYALFDAPLELESPPGPIDQIVVVQPSLFDIWVHVWGPGAVVVVVPDARQPCCSSRC